MWSADGSRLAFSDSASLYVLNLADWSIVIVPGLNAFEHPALSPDGDTIAFECMIDAGNRDICAVHADGTGFVRLTSDPGLASDPRFSVDGSKIGFANPDWVVINADGTGITTAAPGDFAVPAARTVYVLQDMRWLLSHALICQDSIYIDGMWLAIGNNPTWALSHHPFVSLGFPQCDGLMCVFDASGSWVSDGTTIDHYSWNFGDGTTGVGPQPSHAFAAIGRYDVTVSVTTTAGVTSTGTARIDVVANRRPVAAFTYACTGSQCGFDGSGSSDPDGALVTYQWNFGDGYGASGITPSHRYTAVGTFPVSLYVTDNDGAWAGQQQSVVISSVTNAPPIATFDAVCLGLTCTANALFSRDPDGSITRYAWDFGDGTTGDGAIVGHTYAAAGTYAMTLAVTDNVGATATYTRTVTAVRLPVHVGDLDGTATAARNKWNATVTITVHDSGHSPITGVAVTGVWNDGASASCTTSADGRCAVVKAGVLKTANAGFSI